MQKARFISIVDAPTSVSVQQTSELNEIVKQFPYFQTARLLHLKGLHKQQSLSFDYQLKSTAIHCYDRENLYYFILQKELSEKIITAEQTITQPKSENRSAVDDALAKEAAIVPKEDILEPFTAIDIEKETTKKGINELEALIIEEAISSSISLEVDAILASDKVNKTTNKTTLETTNSTLKKELAEVKDTPKSFSDWLKQDKTSKNNIENTKKEKNIESIIDEFITKNPKPSSPKKEFFSPNKLARLSVIDKGEFVTETLAKIYVKQGNLEKALTAFQQLSLNYPEKSVYFANQIKLIKKQIKNK